MFTRPPCLMLLAALAAAWVLPSSAWGQYSRHVSPGGAGVGAGYSGFGGGHGGFGGYSPFGNVASANPGLGRPNNLSLVIAQTQEGHDGVTDLLEQLRRLQDQQVKLDVRFNTLNDSFYERIGVGFGFNLRGADPAGRRGIVGLDPLGQATPNGDIQFRQGGVGSAIPPFGGHDPATDATMGFAIRGGQGDLLFNLFAGQGSSRSLVTQVPMVVIPSGGNGTFSDTFQTPFVTSVIPVVGAPNMQAITGYGYGPAFHAPQQSVLQQKIEQLKYDQIRQLTEREASGGSHAFKNTPAAAEGRAAPDAGSMHLGGGAGGGSSSADRGDLSIAEIRRQQAAGAGSDDAELAAIIARAQGAEAAGNLGAAKINYKMAIRRAEGERKQQLTEKLRELERQ